MAETMATRQAYGKTLIELGEKYPQLVVMDADLSKSTMTAEFGKTYPDRFFNMGIAEQNLYGAAAGLALSGKIVCASTFAMFATGRAFEIIRNSIGYTRANVKICATHAGITVGEDGASHQTFEDIALMRTVPGMTVINPSVGVSAKKLLEQAVAWCRMFGLEFDAVNENVAQTLEQYGTESRKISADVYIDDKACWPWMTKQEWEQYLAG